MKNLTILLAFALFFGSCKVTIPMGNSPEMHPKPFLKFKNGKKIEPQHVTIKSKKIKTDSSSYKKKDISSYSDGRYIFGSVKKSSFAKEIYNGDINVFQTVTKSTSTSYMGATAGNPSGWHTSSHTSIKYYLQKNGTEKLVFFNFKSAKKMILPKDPGFKYLNTYKSHRLIDDIVMLGGFGMFCAGSAIVGSSINSSTGHGQGAGFAVMLGGASAIITGAVMSGINHINLRRAIAKHNGLAVED